MKGGDNENENTTDNISTSVNSEEIYRSCGIDSQVSCRQSSCTRYRKKKRSHGTGKCYIVSEAGDFLCGSP